MKIQLTYDCRITSKPRNIVLERSITSQQQRQRDDEAQYRRYMLRLERMKQRRQELRHA